MNRRTTVLVRQMLFGKTSRCSKYRFRLIGALIMLYMGLMSAEAQCPKYLKSIISASPSARAERVKRLYKESHDSIPILIQHIGDEGEITTVSLAKPSESFAQLSPMYCGVLAAYLVEFMLGSEKLSIQGNTDFFLGADPSNYLYRLGIITSNQTGAAVGKTDLTALKSIYSNWWRLNQVKTIPQLRSEWKDGKRPLTNSSFAWK
jgi:hypothetical protein